MSGFKSGNREKGMGNRTPSRGVVLPAAPVLQFPTRASPSGNGEKEIGNRTLSHGVMVPVAPALQFPIPHSRFPLSGPTP